MTTNAPRDWHVDAGRLLGEHCGHAFQPIYKHQCPTCLRLALAAAYEAGRADAGALAQEGCYCDVPPVATPETPCDCCHAAAGEPCRHEVKP